MFPDHSPFSPEQRISLEQLLAGFSPAQRYWLGGFLSAGAQGQAVGLPVAAGGGGTKLTILYGTESGNSEKLANQSAKEAKKRGYQVLVKNMADIAPSELAKWEHLLVIVSTWGDGDPPESVVSFHKEFMSASQDLAKVKFSVCALGDTSYEKFCKTGKDFDERLEVLGAKRVFARQDCDVDYEDAYKGWLEGALESFGPVQAASVVPVVGGFAPFAAAAAYGRKNPYQAELTERVLLNGKGTKKETWHYEFSLQGSGLSYEPGDALGVVPVNAADMVEGVLKAAKLNGSEVVNVKDVGEKPLVEALREDFDITTLSRPVLEKLRELTKSKKLAELLGEGSRDKLKDYLWGRWIVDAVLDFAPKKGVTAQDLVSLLRKLPPRLYSIASSPLAHPEEVHLTVSSVRYQANGKERKGVASTYLADMVKAGEKVKVYTHENKNFRLPASGDTPVIMVGPGTGVAPFRAFVEHRGELGHKGRNWLFFGDQHYLYDFLYQVEWQEHLANGVLSKLDVAFSRDQPEKIYVQHRIEQQGKDLWAWLQEGAHLYVCGDASRMAHDVNDALIAVVEKHGGKSREAAEAYVDELKKAKRYQRDVY